MEAARFLTGTAVNLGLSIRLAGLDKIPAQAKQNRLDGLPLQWRNCLM